MSHVISIGFRSVHNPRNMGRSSYLQAFDPEKTIAQVIKKALSSGTRNAHLLWSNILTTSRKSSVDL